VDNFDCVAFQQALCWAYVNWGCLVDFFDSSDFVSGFDSGCLWVKAPGWP